VRSSFRAPGPKVVDAAKTIIDALTSSQAGASKGELARLCSASKETVQRALNWLRNDNNAPIEFRRPVWRLTEPYRLPLLSPQPDDLTAVVLAGAMLETVADPDLAHRVQELVAELDQRLRAAGTRGLIPARGVSATMTFGATIDRRRLEKLLQATLGKVVEIEHRKVWRKRGEPAFATIRLEPWSCRVHDGMAYVRGFARDRDGARTYRIADIDSVRVVPNARTSQRRPPPDEIWGDRDPRFGIDEHKPGEARIVVRGAVARWFEPVVLHPQQESRWLEPNEVLERRVPYRSRRELARRLLSIIDGLVMVEPEELRLELSGYVKAAHDRGLITWEA